jgi:hypothetical protein
LFQETQHRFIGDKVKVVINKDVFFVLSGVILNDAKVPLELLRRNREAKLRKFYRRIPAHGSRSGYKVFPKAFGDIIPFRKLHPSGKGVTFLYEGINSVGLTVTRSGHNHHQRTVDCLFQQAVNPGPFQVNSVSRRYRGESLKKLFRQLIFLITFKSVQHSVGRYTIKSNKYPFATM